ncbi:hypothetical protein Q9R29_04525 [Rothia sp. ARF10]|nr:hypothetical protein [Rothia sp. ARF10]
MSVRLTRGIATLLAAVVTAAGLSSAATAAVSPAADVTSWSIEGPAGSFAGGQVWMTTASTVQTYPVEQGVAVYGNGANGYPGRVFAFPPEATTFAAGRTYPTANSVSATHARVDINYPVYCTSTTTGSVTVHEARYDDDNQLVRFAASYTQSCDGGPAVTGEVRSHSTVDTVRQVAAPNGPTSQVVTVRSAKGTTFGRADFETAPPASYGFAISEDGCSDRTVPAGGSCTLKVSGWPGDLGSGRQATVVLPDVAGVDGRRIPVDIISRDTPLGAFATVTNGPRRILDTRAANGVTTRSPLGTGQTLAVQVAGRGGVPSTASVTSVVMNVTAVSPTSGGYLSVHPGPSRATTSSINFTKGVNLANLVTVPLGPDGKVRFANGNSGTVHVLADVVGYYRTSAPTTLPYGSFRQTQLQRIVDTRSEFGPLPGGYYFDVTLDYNGVDGPEVNSHVTAALVNLTTTTQSGSGYLTAWSGAGEMPATSSINFVRGRSQANMALIPVRQEYDADTDRFYPTVRIDNPSGAATNVIIDIVGLYDDNTLIEGWTSQRFRPLPAPVRIVDTRSSLGMAALSAGQTRKVPAPSSVAGHQTYGLVANLTAVSPTTTTWLTAWDADARPGVSNLNTVGKVSMANAAMVPLTWGNTFLVNNAAGSTHVLVDVAGSLEAYPVTAPPPSDGTSLSPSRSGSAGHADHTGPAGRFEVQRPTAG